MGYHTTILNFGKILLHTPKCNLNYSIRFGLELTCDVRKIYTGMRFHAGTSFILVTQNQPEIKHLPHICIVIELLVLFRGHSHINFSLIFIFHLLKPVTGTVRNILGEKLYSTDHAKNDTVILQANLATLPDLLQAMIRIFNYYRKKVHLRCLIVL